MASTNADADTSAVSAAAPEPATKDGLALRRKVFSRARTVVVKVGTGVLTLAGGRLNKARIRHLAEQVQRLRAVGKSVVIVSSGAVGAGIGRLNLPGRPADLAGLQGAAAVGQPLLMRAWSDAFGKFGVPVAQILVTRGDFENRTAYLNMESALRGLAAQNAVAILNENDTVAVEELRFTDNDGLAALICHLTAADVLVLLTSVDGLLAPVNGELVPFDVVERITPSVRAVVGAEKTSLGRGGMATKLDAVARVTAGGAAVVIANGKKSGTIDRVFAGETEGTLFPPTGKREPARLRWIGQAARPAGRLAVDAGAAAALAAGKSLLPGGVTGCEGRFERGDVVAVVSAEGNEIARGLANYSSDEVARIKGLKTARIAEVLGSKPFDEVIHADHLVLV
jgi:glutamate 5-kinase